MLHVRVRIEKKISQSEAMLVKGVDVKIIQLSIWSGLKDNHYGLYLPVHPRNEKQEKHSDRNGWADHHYAVGGYELGGSEGWNPEWEVGREEENSMI